MTEPRDINREREPDAESEPVLHADTIKDLDLPIEEAEGIVGGTGACGPAQAHTAKCATT